MNIPPTSHSNPGRVVHSSKVEPAAFSLMACPVCLGRGELVYITADRDEYELCAACSGYGEIVA